MTLACLACGVAASTTAAVPLKPVDPFDYSYCGGEPVYPVIGYNFASYCGPRNQIALGRRGSLMWLFPDAENKSVLHRGVRKLSEAELKRLSLLAEVVYLSEPVALQGGPVVYALGIDFSGRPYKRFRTSLNERYSPADALFRAMLGLVKDAPLLPACSQSPADFDPTLLPAERVHRSAPIHGERHGVR